MSPSLFNIWIALGGNLGDRPSHLRFGAAEAIRRLHRASPDAVLASSLYETSPVGGPSHQSPYLNAVLRIQTDQQPLPALHELLDIEKTLGRVRTQRDGPRILDLDILFFDQRIINSAELQIPHPRLHLRRFVLEPLCEIAPELRHPVLGLTMLELLTELRASGNEEWVKILPGESLLTTSINANRV